MKSHIALQTLELAGIRLKLRWDRTRENAPKMLLKYSAPPGAITEPRMNLLKAHKTDILQQLWGRVILMWTAKFFGYPPHPWVAGGRDAWRAFAKTSTIAQQNIAIDDLDEYSSLRRCA